MNNTINIENLMPDFELLDTFGVEPADDAINKDDQQVDHKSSSCFPDETTTKQDLLEQTSKAIGEQPALVVLNSNRTTSSNIQPSFKTPRVIQLDSQTQSSPP